jgi:hypothetical protein
MKKILNFGFFQINWLGCIIGATTPYPWVFPLITVFYACIHFIYLSDLAKEIYFSICLFTIALVWEYLFVSSGYIIYNGTDFLNIFGVPGWILGLWLMFILTINHSMLLMNRIFVVTPLLGAIFGPLTYLAGERLGAAILINKPASIIFIAISWGILFPLFIWIGKIFREKYYANLF